MEKRYGILILGTFACAACFLLSACAGPAAEQSSVQPPYDGQTQDADVFIDMPNLRQYGGYTCGTTCVQMVMNWLDPYQADWNLAAYEEELGTNEEAGTPPGSIVSFFEENSVTVTAKENRTTSELASALYQGHPVLLCIQAWAAAEDGYNTQNSDDADTYLAEGHWVICVGYQKQELGYVFYFNDPACVGYCMMSEQDLNNRWIDMDTEGNVYDHYGIEITATNEL